MGNVLSILRSRVGKASCFAVLAALAWHLYTKKQRRNRRQQQQRREGASSAASSTSSKGVAHTTRKRRKPKIGKDFLKQFKAIMKRGVKRREMFDLAALTSVLIGRTLMSLYIAINMGTTVKHFCNCRWKEMGESTLRFAGVSTIAAVLNAGLKYFIAKVSLDVRERLTSTIHDSYMKNMNYYKANKVADEHGVLENADQLITDDVGKFADTLSDVYANLLKPVVDFVLFSANLTSMMGPSGPLGMYAWFAIATVISAKVLPAYGKMAAREQQLEGRYRAVHTALIQNSEMVAFMRGEKRERAILDDHFTAVRRHVQSTLARKLTSNIVTGYVNKYAASVVGFALVAYPVYRSSATRKWSAGEVAKYYVASRQLLEGLANAVLAIFDLQKRIGTLAGLTGRVSYLLRGLEQRTPILQAETKAEAARDNAPVFEKGDILDLDGVSVYKPDGTLLVKDLTFTVRPGERVIITGDNGCGKSSLFRVLRGLWPLAGGHIVCPDDKEVYFLSQVNFVPVGSLREIIIYPHTLEDMKAAGKTDADLRQALAWSHLTNFKCEGMTPTLDTVLEWDTALSPGQKQRMAFARLLYHRPRYAVLDECTNGVAPDIEEDLYNRCRSLGMAVFSISHKVELRRLHDYRLHYSADGEGSYTFSRIRADGAQQ